MNPLNRPRDVQRHRPDDPARLGHQRLRAAEPLLRAAEEGQDQLQDRGGDQMGGQGRQIRTENLYKVPICSRRNLL